MTHITVINILCCLVGISFSFLTRLQSAMKRKGGKPSGQKWVAENWLETMLGTIATFTAIFFMDEIGSTLGFTVEPGTGEAFFSFLCGLNGQFFISKIQSLIRK